jgi:hypothetical protein
MVFKVMVVRERRRERERESSLAIMDMITREVMTCLVINQMWLSHSLCQTERERVKKEEMRR